MSTGHRTRPNGSWLLRTAVVGVLLLAAGAFVLSYSALHAVAIAAGINPALAGLYPLIIDGFITIASLAALFLRDHGPKVTWYPWSLLGGFFTVSVWCNALHAASRTGHIHLDGGTAALVSAMPPIALGLAIHLLILMLRPTAPASQGSADLSAAPASPDTSPDLAHWLERPPHVNGSAPAGRKTNTPASNNPTRPTKRPQPTPAGDRNQLRHRATAAIREAEHANTELTGAELGRRLGISTRHGRRLLHSLEAQDQMPTPSPDRDNSAVLPTPSAPREV